MPKFTEFNNKRIPIDAYFEEEDSKPKGSKLIRSKMPCKIPCVHTHFISHMQESIQGTYCMRQMYPHLEAMNFVKFIYLYLPHTTQNACDHARIQTKLFASKEVKLTEKDLTWKEAKMFSNFWYMGDTITHEAGDGPKGKGLTIKDRTLEIVDLYPHQFWRKPKAYYHGRKVAYRWAFTKELRHPRVYGEKLSNGTEWWKKSVQWGKEALLQSYKSMVRITNEDEDGKDFLETLFVHLLLAEYAYEDHPFYLMESVEECYEYEDRVGKEDPRTGKKKIDPRYIYELGIKYQDKLKNYTPVVSIDPPTPNDPKAEKFTGLHGGRLIKNCTVYELLKTWRKKVWGQNVPKKTKEPHPNKQNPTPVDNLIHRHNFIDKKQKGCFGKLKKYNLTKFKITVPRYYLAKNEAEKTILIGVRGTKNFGDIQADMKCMMMPSACNQGMVHQAMNYAAIVIAADLYPQLKELMAGEFEKIVCVGHSLGGSTASLVAILLNTPKKLGGCGFTDKVKCYGYGTPPCINVNCDWFRKGCTQKVIYPFPKDIECTQKAKDFQDNTFLKDTDKYIITVVNQSDLVPRMSPQNIQAYVWASDNGSKEKELNPHMLSWMKCVYCVCEGANTVQKDDQDPEELGPRKIYTDRQFSRPGCTTRFWWLYKDFGRWGIRKGLNIMQWWGLKWVGTLHPRSTYYQFGQMWLPGAVHNISYQHLGVFKKGLCHAGYLMCKKEKIESATISPNCKVEALEKKKSLCLHRVPRNHPRVCSISGDLRMFSDHLTANGATGSNGYVANIAELLLTEIKVAV
jgi:hypothetical protein